MHLCRNVKEMTRKLLFIAVSAFFLIWPTAQTAYSSNEDGFFEYGKFYYVDDIPEVLFFVGEIEANDSLFLRKALRSHDISTLVLMSPGGSVWEGLNLSAIVNDNELATYIPTKSICASACSFVFFGGTRRLIEGELGVHQFSAKKNETVNINEAQKGAQFTASEIIGVLNQYDVPPWVYEKMFYDSEMYFFSAKEKNELSNLRKSMIDNYAKIEQFIGFLDSELIDEPGTVAEPSVSQPEKIVTSPPALNPLETKKSVQQQLTRLGCYNGPLDGVVGTGSRAALNWLQEVLNLNLNSYDWELGSLLQVLVNLNGTPCQAPISDPLMGRWHDDGTCGLFCSIVKDEWTFQYISPGKYKLKSKIIDDRASALWSGTASLAGNVLTLNVRNQDGRSWDGNGEFILSESGNRLEMKQKRNGMDVYFQRQ
jgi:peptidoglycan hydrolase-like protein with peptidoglycan-binding domain